METTGHMSLDCGEMFLTGDANLRVINVVTRISAEQE